MDDKELANGVLSLLTVRGNNQHASDQNDETNRPLYVKSLIWKKGRKNNLFETTKQLCTPTGTIHNSDMILSS